MVIIPMTWSAWTRTGPPSRAAFLEAIVAQGMTPEAMPNLATMLHYAAQAAIEASPEIALPAPRILERQDNVLTGNFRRW